MKAGGFFHAHIGKYKSMAKHLIIFASFLIYISSACGQEQHAADQKLIENLYHSIDAAWESHDADALAKNFTDDADFTNVRGTTAHGQKAIIEMHSDLFKGPFKDSHIRTLNMQTRFLSDNIADVDIHWEMTNVNWPDGTPRPDRKGLANATLEKRDGKWLIVVSHNMDLPEPHSSSKSQ